MRDEIGCTFWWRDNGSGKRFRLHPLKDGSVSERLRAIRAFLKGRVPDIDEYIAEFLSDFLAAATEQAIHPNGSI